MMAYPKTALVGHSNDVLGIRVPHHQLLLLFLHAATFDHARGLIAQHLHHTFQTKRILCVLDANRSPVFTALDPVALRS